MILFLTVVHVLVSLVLIVVVLLQRGKGAEIGAVFGGGGGATVFGSRGPATFLTKLTTVAAVIFMLTSATLAYFGQSGSQSTLFNQPAKSSQTQKAPPSPFEESPAPAKPAPQAEKKGESSGFKEVKPPPAAKQEKPAKP